MNITYDMQLVAAFTIDTPDEATGARWLQDILQSASINAGALPNGEPLVGEASLDGEPVACTDDAIFSPFVLQPPPEVMQAALKLVRELAAYTTPEEEFEARKGDDGVVYDDGMTYDDADEMVAEFSDDRLMDEHSTFMANVRAAKAILARAA